MSQLINVRWLDTRCRQAVPDRALGEIPRMLLSAEPLLGRRGNDFPVDHQCYRRIVPLRDAVFTLLQTGPM